MHENTLAGYSLTAILIGNTANDIGLLTFNGASNLGPTHQLQYYGTGTENVGKLLISLASYYRL